MVYYVLQHKKQVTFRISLMLNSKGGQHGTDQSLVFHFLAERRTRVVKLEAPVHLVQPLESKDSAAESEV